MKGLLYISQHPSSIHSSGEPLKRIMNVSPYLNQEKQQANSEMHDAGIRRVNVTKEPDL